MPNQPEIRNFLIKQNIGIGLCKTVNQPIGLPKGTLPVLRTETILLGSSQNTDRLQECVNSNHAAEIWDTRPLFSFTFLPIEDITLWQ